jgi:CheY-like chemotaxis protein
MKNMKVLVVDDEETIVSAIKKALEKEGYIVFSARNYNTALQQLSGSKPDAVITDMMMPYTGGFDLIDYLKEDPTTKNIPVILITGMDKEILQSTLSKANVIIEKPFDVKDILSHLSRLTYGNNTGAES